MRTSKVSIIWAIAGCIAISITAMGKGGVFQPDIIQPVDTLYVEVIVEVPLHTDTLYVQTSQKCEGELSLEGMSMILVSHYDLDGDGYGFLLADGPAGRYFDGYRMCDGTVVLLDKPTLGQLF